MPKISIIVPVYNIENYLCDCVDSILNQTFTDFELILVDDGSTDNSGKICDQYAKKYDNIIVLHKNNGGLSSARNFGLDEVFNNSNSDYLMFVDSDDCIHRQTLDVLLNLIHKYDADISMCHYDFFVKNDEMFEQEVVFNNSVDNIEIFNGIEILESFKEYERRVSLRSQCMKLYRKNIFKDLRMALGRTQEDSIILPYVLERANQIVKINLPLYHWRWTNGSISRSEFSIKNFDYIEIYRSDSEFFIDRKMIDSANYCKNKFMQQTLGYYYKVKSEFPDLLPDFKIYINNYRSLFLRYYFIPNICINERIAYLLFMVSPSMAKKYYFRIYNKGDIV